MNKRQKKAEWFESWFNSRYYHVLYQNRDDKEAHLFIDNLLKELKLPAKAKILDLACGNGRHAICLNQRGYEVIGIDLSDENIAQAKKYQNETLSFYVHDMRDLYWDRYFDCILNLFTSFGYFEDDEDNQKTINSVASSLKHGGKFVLDFMNSEKVIDNLVLQEKKLIDGISFIITRRVVDNRIVKKIHVIDGETEQGFEEKVRAFTLNELMDLMEEAGLYVENVFGDYNLGKYDSKTSDRLIILASK